MHNKSQLHHNVAMCVICCYQLKRPRCTKKWYWWNVCRM